MASVKAPPPPEDSPKPPAAFKISRQLDQEKIDFLSSRVDGLIVNNNELRTNASRNEKDNHDIVLYFQREMEMKDDVITRLNEELVKRETQLKFEVEKMRKKFEQELKEEKFESSNTIADLRGRLATSDMTLNQVKSYVDEKDKHEKQLKDLEKTIEDQRIQMFDGLEHQERRFLEDKAQIIKEQEHQMQAFREVALRDARVTMGTEAQKLMVNNNHMYEELKFLHALSAELQTEKARLETSLVIATRDVTILADKELEYAKQGISKAKEIKTLRERVEFLEKMQVVNVERFKHRAKDLRAAVSKELEEATLDAAGLRRLMQMKNKELRHMKTLAATILDQRSEIEQFFLEALQEVKDMIKKEKKKSYQDSKVEMAKMRSAAASSVLPNRRRHRKGVGRSSMSQSVDMTTTNDTTMFPSIKIQSSTQKFHLDSESRANTKLGQLQNSKIEMKDLSLDDKELVLRVLFAKMNGLNKNEGTFNNEAAIHSARSEDLFGEDDFGEGDFNADEDLKDEEADKVFISEGKGMEDTAASGFYVSPREAS